MRISDWSSDVCSSDLVVAQQDAGDVTDVHVGAPASNASGSRATLMNSSSSDATPCSAGSRRGSPCSNTRPCETNSTRSQTASTSYMLCEVQRMPLSPPAAIRSEEHTSELQSLMRISYAVFCLKKKKLNIYKNI